MTDEQRAKLTVAIAAYKSERAERAAWDAVWAIPEPKELP